MTPDQHAERIAITLAGLPEERQCALLADAFTHWCVKHPEHAHRMADPRVLQLIHEIWQRIRELEQGRDRPC